MLVITRGYILLTIDYPYSNHGLTIYLPYITRGYKKTTTYDCWDIHPSGRNDVLGAPSNCWVGRDLMQPFDISIEEVPFQYLMI
jgi:hypothetical protein